VNDQLLGAVIGAGAAATGTALTLLGTGLLQRARHRREDKAQREAIIKSVLVAALFAMVAVNTFRTTWVGRSVIWRRNERIAASFNETVVPPLARLVDPLVVISMWRDRRSRHLRKAAEALSVAIEALVEDANQSEKTFNTRVEAMSGALSAFRASVDK
jgi:hypothetical protein